MAAAVFPCEVWLRERKQAGEAAKSVVDLWSFPGFQSGAPQSDGAHTQLGRYKWNRPSLYFIFFPSFMPPRRVKNGREARGENQLSAAELAVVVVGGGGVGDSEV